MEYIENFGQKEICFDVLANDKDLLDKLAFVHLVQMKFKGKIDSASSFGNGDKKLLQIRLLFPGWNECSDARAHCDRNLDNSGCVVSDYRGALDKADPGRKFAQKFQKKAIQNCSDE